MTGICLLEPWVTAADPHVGPKLEPDPVPRREAAGPALPFHWPVASPGLVGRKGHILMSECPAISSSMPRAKAYITLDTHWRPSGCIGLLSWLKANLPHGSILLVRLFSQSMSRLFPEA